MTTVIVTRDNNGVQVWKPGTQVELTRMHWYKFGNFWGEQQESDNSVWTSKGFNKLLFNEKQVENWFPELLALIQLGEIKELQIKITFTK